MTIPKIINITDNLLANSITNNGSIEALCQLTHEIYFPLNIQDGDSDENIVETSENELYTQKEVVFSMLLKFIDSIIVKKTICVILMKDASTLSEIKKELSENLVNILEEKKPIINNSDDYNCMRNIVTSAQMNFLTDKSDIIKLQSRLINHRNSVSSNSKKKIKSLLNTIYFFHHLIELH